MQEDKYDAYGPESLAVLRDLLIKHHMKKFPAATQHGNAIHQSWADGSLTLETAVGSLTVWHKNRPAPDFDDGLAKPNPFGMTDSQQLNEAQTDLTSLYLLQLHSMEIAKPAH